jgi:outer membrane protein assembly factor BamD
VIKKQYEIGDRLYEKGQARINKHWRLARKRPFKRAIEVYSMVIENQPFTDAAAEAQYKVGLCHHTRKEWVEAAFEYRRVVEDYSTSDWVDDAMHGLAKCYYDASRPANYDQAPSQLAVAAIDDFKGRFPSDERIGELDAHRAEMRKTMALQRLQTAQFYEKRRDFGGARLYYGIVDKDFSDTPSAEKARQWLDKNPSMESEAVVRVLTKQRTNS